MDQLAELEACRICVTCYPLRDMDFIYIFHKSEEFQAELDFIQGEIRQWQLKIVEDDGLPQRICANCFAKFCSILAFRKECEQSQEKLLQTFMQNQETPTTASSSLPSIKLESPNKQAQQQQSLLTQTDTPLPLVGGNYAAAVNSSLEMDQQVLVPSSDHVVGLNDFPVFDQQFEHYDNPALMDSSATLLNNNLMDPSNSHELEDFLPTQNLFNFDETAAEPPSTGTLPLVETEIPSIMGGGLMEVPTTTGNDAAMNTNVNDDNTMIKHDLEDILQGSIIPTNANAATSTSLASNTINNNNYNYNNLNKVNTRTTNVMEKLATKATTTIKTEPNGISSQRKNVNLNNKKANTQPTQPLNQREDNASDNECDESHVNIRLKGLPYTCHYCYCPSTGPIEHLSFADEDTLSQHFFDKHDPNRPYNCPQCLYSYKTKRLRDNHVRINHEVVNKIKKCNYCQKILKGAIEMHQYNCQHVGDWECIQCKEKFPNTPLYRFRLHQRQHERKNFKCRMCERSFMRKAYLDAHEKMHKSESTMQYNCEQCNTKFHTDYDLRRHRYQHHNDERPVKCKNCPQEFSSIAFLQRHILQIHSKDAATNSDNVLPSQQSSQHICLKCNLTFATVNGLQRHIQEASVNNGQCMPPSTYNSKERRRIQRQGVFPCFLCPRRFHLRSQLDKHLNTHDARLRPFQCEQCYVRCRTVIELKQHINVTHLNIKEFVCDKCGKCFGYKKDLREHKLFHGEISVYCSEEGCDYACKNEKALRDHIRHKHRLLSCEYCQEKFTRQKLTVHLRHVHRSEIDVELAGESDFFYKSKLLNNNNDITQISFNLLNNTQAISTATTPTSTPSSSSSSYSVGGIAQAIASLTTSPSSSSSTSCISHTNLSMSPTTSTHTTPILTTSISHNENHMQHDSQHQQLQHIMQQQPQQQQQQQLHQQQEQMPTIFVTDHNSNNLALNGFVNTNDDLNSFGHHQTAGQEESNMFMIPSSTNGCSSSPTASGDDHHQLDQYFMASLVDTEQEIIVS